MTQRGQLSIVSIADQQKKGSYTNPYTFSGVTLALIMGRVINAHHDYATTETLVHNEVDTEIERLRLYNEVLLYAARICEVAIKQLLYCTQIPESQYKLYGTLVRCLSPHVQAVRRVTAKSLMLVCVGWHTSAPISFVS